MDDETIGGSGTLFAGEDKALSFEILDADGVPVDIGGSPPYVIVFDVRRRDASDAPAILSKTATIDGTYDADPAVNTQRAVVTLTSDDLPASIFGLGIRYRYSLKRTDTGAETILRRGAFIVERATQI